MDSDLQEVQEFILRASTHPNYRDHYRDQEITYWRHIPAWIREDSLTRPIRRVLDIGCAYGTLLAFTKVVTGAEVFGTDFMDDYLSPVVRDHFDISFAISNIEFEAPPWPDMSFDIVILSEVLEHLNFHPATTLARIRDLVAPGGRLYLSTPDAAEWGVTDRYYPSLDAIPEAPVARPELLVDDHVWQYDETELRREIVAAGFSIERMAFAEGTEGRHFNLSLSVEAPTRAKQALSSTLRELNRHEPGSL